jgi:hypothetical protein
MVSCRDGFDHEDERESAQVFSHDIRLKLACILVVPLREHSARWYDMSN